MEYYRIYSEKLTDEEYNAWLSYMSDIFCPLCEHWHKNNTFCQMNESDESDLGPRTEEGEDWHS